MHTPNTQQQAVGGLLKFLPALQNTEPQFTRNGYWGEMSSVVSALTARDLFRYLYENGFVMEDFDWVAWGETALSYLDDRVKLQTADWLTLYQLLTAHIRADQSNPGHYDAILENGFLRDVLVRMRTLQEENEQN